jgi:hypothetical protein
MTAFPNRKDKIKFVPSMLLKMLMAPRIWWMLSHKLVAQVIFIYSTAAFLNLNCLVCHIQPVYKLDRIIQNTVIQVTNILRQVWRGPYITFNFIPTLWCYYDHIC